MSEPMIRVIPHKRNRRYRVDRYDEGRWNVFGWYRFAWRAKQVARTWESFNVFKYRAVDTRPKGKNR